MVGDERALSSVRISLGETTGPADVDAAIKAFTEVVVRARGGRPPG
jgi:cysteine sulfinate desulfinase/cysteine desulfurase-like protein